MNEQTPVVQPKKSLGISILAGIGCGIPTLIVGSFIALIVFMIIMILVSYIPGFKGIIVLPLTLPIYLSCSGIFGVTGAIIAGVFLGRRVHAHSAEEGFGKRFWMSTVVGGVVSILVFVLVIVLLIALLFAYTSIGGVGESMFSIFLFFAPVIGLTIAYFGGILATWLASRRISRKRTAPPEKEAQD